MKGGERERHDGKQLCERERGGKREGEGEKKLSSLRTHTGMLMQESKGA